MEKIALTIPGMSGTPIDSGLPSGVPTGGLSNGMGQNIVIVAIEVLVLGAIFLFLYYAIRGGINMITSGGEKERFAKGRERVRYAIIGLVLIFMSIFLVNLFSNFFGIKLLSFLE